MIESQSAQQIWEAALGELQIQVNKSNYRTWLEKTKGLSYQEDSFVIGVPNTFVAEYLDKNQRSLVERVLAGLVHNQVQVQFQVDTNQLNPAASNNSRAKASLAQQASLPLFNPRYTFDSFVQGDCNRLAHSAAWRVAQSPGQNFNPLFIYGGTGLGKTHLLQAIGHIALADSLKVIYVSAEQYTNELMSALREKKTADFHQKYRSADMLLVDDVQFFSGKEQTGESFFHNFDVLHNTNRQIALTCDRPPRSLAPLNERLRSRLEGGLATEIQPPDFETRLAILQAKANQDDTSVPTGVLEFIALQIQQNIRMLEGALNRVVAYAKLIRATLTPELATQALKDIANNKLPANQSISSSIIEAIVNCFRIAPADLKGRKRDGTTVLARQVAIYLLRQETNCSLSEIGQELGGRSPATVSHAYQKIAGDIDSSPSLKRKVLEIKRGLPSTTTKQNQ